MKVMKCFFLAGALAMALSTGLFAASLAGAKTVYVMPMANGLDQYVAARLTNAGVLRVVTDPHKADVVFTDHLGQSFEESLAELYSAKGAPAADTPVEFSRVGGRSSRAPGMAFVVDPKTKEVLWSGDGKVKQTNSDSLKRAADRIVQNLARAMKGGAEK